MTMKAAIAFIKQARVDNELRKQLNIADNQAERENYLQDMGLVFNYAEFEDAYNNMLSSCQTEDEASVLQEFKMWWDFLIST